MFCCSLSLRDWSDIESGSVVRSALCSCSLQATEQAERLREQQRREERENVAEIWHTATSDMMTERAEAAKRWVGGGRPPRVMTDRWKGMSPAQLGAIHKERVTQCVERQVRINLGNNTRSFLDQC